MEVSNNVKNAYRRDTITKHMSLYFPELDKEITGEPIHSESMSLSEQLIDKDSIEFVGCISSQFKIKVQGLREDVKGEKIIVRIWTDGTEEEPLWTARCLREISSASPLSHMMNSIPKAIQKWQRGISHSFSRSH